MPHDQLKPPRKRRRRSLRSAAATLFAFAILAIATAAAVFLYGKWKFEEPGPLAQEATVVIDRGLGTARIAQRLEDAGAISDARLFLAAAVATDRAGRLKAGEYSFPAGASMASVMDKLAKGRAIARKLTIPEGLTSAQIVERVRAEPALTGEIGTVPDEGTLLPETYHFQRGDDRQALIDRMRAAHDTLLETLWSERDTSIPVETPEDAVILASIVEKETGIPEERPEVAAVFHNRLKRGMRLQSDPTIIYGISGGDGPLDRPLTKSDIDEKTDYNTYQIDGLPPTPIANPGRAALEAVLKPADTKALYFVADGTGGHVFANTLAEHRRNVGKWRKIEKEMRLEAEKAEAAAAEAAAEASADEGEGANASNSDAAAMADDSDAAPAPETVAPDDTPVPQAEIAALEPASEGTGEEGASADADADSASTGAPEAAGNAEDADEADRKTAASTVGPSVPLPRPKPARPAQ